MRVATLCLSLMLLCLAPLSGQEFQYDSTGHRTVMLSAKPNLAPLVRDSIVHVLRNPVHQNTYLCALGKPTPDGFIVTELIESGVIQPICDSPRYIGGITIFAVPLHGGNFLPDHIKLVWWVLKERPSFVFLAAADSIKADGSPRITWFIWSQGHPEPQPPPEHYDLKRQPRS